MKNLFKFIGTRIKNFFVNPFWLSLPSLIMVIVSLLLNALIWYFFAKKYHVIIGYQPIAFSSAVILLNTFLSVIVYRREVLASYILLSTALTVQLIYLVFLRFLALSQTF